MRSFDSNRRWLGAGRGFLIAVAAWMGGCVSEDVAPPMDMQSDPPDLGRSVPPVDTFDSFDSPLCVPDGFISGRRTLSIQGLALVRTVDSLEHRDVQNRSFSMNWETVSVETLGTPCASATDRVKCQSDVAALKPTTGFGSIYQQLGFQKHSYLVTTQGDSVGLIGDALGVKGFLGPIDTPQEALLLVRAQKDPMWPAFEISCTGKAAGAVHAVADGYQVVAYTTYDFTYKLPIFYQHLLQVTRSGDVTIIQSRQFAPEDCRGCF